MLIGADPQELRILANDFAAKSDQVETIISRLSARLWNTGWDGPDAERFKSTWTRELRPRLESVARALDEICVLVERQAFAQEQTSAAESGGSPSLVVGHPGFSSAPTWTGPTIGDWITGAGLMDDVAGLPKLLETAHNVSRWVDMGGRFPDEFWSFTPKFAPGIGAAIDGAQIWWSVDQYGIGDARTWESIVRGVGSNALDMYVPLGGAAFEVGMDIGNWIGDTPPFEALEDFIADGGIGRTAEAVGDALEDGWDLASSAIDKVWPF